MRVRNLVPWAGHTFSYRPEDVIDLPDHVATGRAAAGLVEIVPQDTPLTGVKRKPTVAVTAPSPDPAPEPVPPSTVKSKKAAK